MVVPRKEELVFEVALSCDTTASACFLAMVVVGELVCSAPGVAIRFTLEPFHHEQENDERSLCHDGVVKIGRHVREGTRFYSLCFSPERNVRLAFKKIERRWHRCGVRRKLVSGGKAKEDHFHIGVIIEGPAEDPPLWDVNFPDDFG